MIAYVKHQGSRLVRKGRTIQVKKGDAVCQTLFVHRVSLLILMGHVEITPPAVNILCREGILTVFLTINGRYKGVLVAEESKNVFLRRRQFQSLDDSDFSLRMAAALCVGKLSNMATLLGRLKRRSKRWPKQDFARKISAVKELIPKAAKAETVASVRGYEGLGTKTFFAGYRFGFKEDWHFSRRVRRPPTDPVNSVLSLLYTLLFNRMLAAVRATGLDPAVGYLHSLDYGRHSLALDLIEEFRSIVVETCTMSLFNLKMLDGASFYYETQGEETPTAPDKPSVKSDSIGYIFENPDDTFFDSDEQKIEENGQSEREPSGKRPCRLRPEALQVVLEAFEDKMTTEFRYPPTNDRVTYAEALFLQARHFREVLAGTCRAYLPLQMK